MASPTGRRLGPCLVLSVQGAVNSTNFSRRLGTYQARINRQERQYVVAAE